jgi:hypothetical protein
MTIQATDRKMKKSFTLAPESVAFLSETRQRRKAGSDSEALDMLLRELMLEAKRQELEAATKETRLRMKSSLSNWSGLRWPVRVCGAGFRNDCA